MKWLLHLMERFKPLFEKGGKLHGSKPVYDATVNFFFGPPSCTPGSPHIRDPLDVKRFMSTVIIALIPCTLASIYFFGLRVLLMILVSYAAGGIVECVFALIRKEEINEGFLVTGLIFPLILPPALPLWIVAVGVMFGVLVGKEAFGGTGRNLFNPAIVGRCFLAIAYPPAMSAAWIKPGSGALGRLTQYVGLANVDVISSATPLANAKHGDYVAITKLFFGNVAGSVGETSALAIILGGVFLLATRVANWRTVVSVLGSFLLLGAILHHFAPAKFAPIGWHFFAGGLLFGAFFMATDPVTGAATNAGKYCFGILVGVTTLLIRNLTGYVEGMMFGLLLGNIAAPIFDEIVYRARFRRLKNEG